MLPYSPRSAGLVEKMNHTLADMLSKLVNRQTTDWDKSLSTVVFAYNVTPQMSTKMPPAQLMFRVCPNLPTAFPVPPRHLLDANDPAAQKQRVEGDLRRVQRNLKEASRKSKQRFDQQHKTRDTDLEIGDVVMRWDPRVQLTKLSLRYTGPYEIVEIRGRMAILIPYGEKKATPCRAHLIHLSKCHPNLTDQLFMGYGGANDLAAVPPELPELVTYLQGKQPE